MRRAVVVVLSEEEQTILKKWSRGKTTAARIVERANVILLAAQGIENNDIAEQLGLSAPMVGKWRKRFFLKRLPGIESDLPRSGRRPRPLSRNSTGCTSPAPRARPHRRGTASCRPPCRERCRCTRGGFHAAWRCFSRAGGSRPESEAHRAS